MTKSNQKISSVFRVMRMAIAMLVLGVTFAMAQTPNMINYQGVATNNAGAALANQSIKLRFKFHQSTVNGTVQYSEVRTATTDATGQFSVQIGGTGATNVTGTWGSINWKSGDKFLQVEMDPAGGSNFVNMGTQQLVSVPYAQYSKMAATLNPSATIDVSQLTSANATNGQVLQYNGTTWAPANVQGGGSLTLPYNASDANGTSFNITNTNSGASTAIKGKADANTATGISGESLSGTAIKGYSNNTGSVAVYGSSLAGTGVKAYSYTGTALDVNGNVKISGGNTNPGVGKVLTSDASGNATWSKKAIVQANGIDYTGTNRNLLNGVTKRVYFQYESIDNTNSYTPAGTQAGNTLAVFTVPVNGIYRIQYKLALYIPSDEIGGLSPRLKSYRPSSGLFTISEIAATKNIEFLFGGGEAFVDFDKIYSLKAGDQLYVEVTATYNSSSILKIQDTGTSFSAELLTAE